MGRVCPDSVLSLNPVSQPALNLLKRYARKPSLSTKNLNNHSFSCRFFGRFLPVPENARARVGSRSCGGRVLRSRAGMEILRVWRHATRQVDIACIRHNVLSKGALLPRDLSVTEWLAGRRGDSNLVRCFTGRFPTGGRLPVWKRGHHGR